MNSEVSSQAVQAAKALSVLKHIKNNNVSYLLGVFVLHSMGVLEKATTYGQGMC